MASEITSEKRSSGALAWRRFLLVVVVVGVSLWTGCAGRGASSFPPCPSPSPEAADELEAVYASSLYVGNLHDWLSAISIYCDAVEVGRQ